MEVLMLDDVGEILEIRLTSEGGHNDNLEVWL